jgi:hypothetical protein
MDRVLFSKKVCFYQGITIGDPFSSSCPDETLSCYDGKNRFIDLRIPFPNEKAVPI